MARITRNRQKALFSLWSFNQSEARKKIFNEKKNNIYDSQSIIKSTIYHKFGLKRSFK